MHRLLRVVILLLVGPAIMLPFLEPVAAQSLLPTQLRFMTGNSATLGNGLRGPLLTLDGRRIPLAPDLRSLHLPATTRLTIETLHLPANLHLHAGRIELRGALRTAGDLDLETPGLLALHAGSALHSRGELAIAADAVSLAGRISAADVEIEARSIVQSAPLNARTTIALRVHESYIADKGATLLAGTDLLIDGGSQAHIYSSGAYRAGGLYGGQIDLFGNTIVLAGARLDASGAQGGGSLRIGGDRPGVAGVPRASQLTVTAASELRADATLQGPGGSVVLWSERRTQAGGTIRARGGPQGGDGGFIEVSSAGELTAGAQLDVSAARGRPGQALLDPENLTIDADRPFPQYELFNPTPDENDRFGEAVWVLNETNRVLVIDSGDDTVAEDAGAVYMFDLASGALLSTLTGSSVDDEVGDFVNFLENGNYVILSPYWDNGAAQDAGAATWGDAGTGVSGIVSAANSLVGTSDNDRVGSLGIRALFNGNYVVLSPNWGNDGAAQAGAATWGDGARGTSGAVTAANSLVGSSPGDQIGIDATRLNNGNYVVRSFRWDNGNIADAGAATWGDGNGGTVGAVTPQNSLVGSLPDDSIGGSDVVPLANGNYVVVSSRWNNGAVQDAGAVTWGNGAGGTVGPVSAQNSLVGSSSNDRIGIDDVVILPNGNYVVASSYWDNGAAQDAGAATWGDGNGGTVGAITAQNSLVGTSANDTVSRNGVYVLSNGNYVVLSERWDRDLASDAGAATWGDGTSGTTGVVSSANSLVGGASGARVGWRLTRLTNGNYVVCSPNWRSGGVTSAGAVTWGDGAQGTSGVVSVQNSLVGSSIDDQVGNELVAALPNGNYVVLSPLWDNGTVRDAGAVTWGNGSGGTTGVVSGMNSLIGTSPDDRVGQDDIAVLPNGNYVVHHPLWDNGAIVDAGAVTWGNGSGGTVGPVSPQNSLVGTSPDDRVGERRAAIVLANGNYVVQSPRWNNGNVSDAGAVTWGNGNGGTTGPVSPLNSLVGSTTDDRVGQAVLALPNGNYVVLSPNWDNGTVQEAGAASLGFGDDGSSGPVSAANSLVGSSPDDQVGSTAAALADGSYLVYSYFWSSAEVENAGALTWGDGSRQLAGPLTAQNSLIGASRFAFGIPIAAAGAGPAQVGGGPGPPRPFNPRRQAEDGSFVVATDTGGGRVRVGVPRLGLLDSERAISQDVNVPPQLLADTLAIGAPLTLQASNAISVTSRVRLIQFGNNPPGDLKLQAGRKIVISETIEVPGGGLTLETSAVTPARTSGQTTIVQQPGTQIALQSAPLMVRAGAGNLAALSFVRAAVTVVSGLLAPGGPASIDSTRISGSLALGAASGLALDLADTSADQVLVTGPVELAGELRLSASLTPDSLHSFVIIDNDGTDPVVGSFAGLPEGALVDAGGVLLQISYTGSDGNDVTLTTPAPRFRSLANTTFVVGQADSFTVQVDSSLTYSLSVSGLPDWLGFDASSGVLSGTPPVGSAGTYPLTFTATSSAGSTVQDFTLTVAATAAPPVFTSADQASFVAGQRNDFQVRADGAPSPTLSASGLPPWLSFDPVSGLLSGTPPDGSAGVYAITFTASNSAGTVDQAFTLTVVAGGDAPDDTHTLFLPLVVR